MKKTLVFILLLLSSSLTILSQELIPEFRITPTVVGKIDRNLFGHFLERPSWGGEIGAEAAYLQNSDTLQAGIFPQLSQMQIPVLRFPGGTDVDYLDWTTLVDNIPGREVKRPSKIRIKKDSVTTGFGYDDAGELCERLGADMVLVVNLGDAYLKKKPIRQAALEQAALLAYCLADTSKNLPYDLTRWAKLRALNGHLKPYPVKYVQIGNEPWFFDKTLHQTNPIEKESVKHYMKCLKIYIDLFEKIAPNVKIIVDGNCLDLTNPLRVKFGNKIDYIAFHSYKPWSIKEVRKGEQIYPMDSLTQEEIWKCWISVPNINKNGYSEFNEKILDNAIKSGYPIAATEWNWNGWWAKSPLKHDTIGERFIKGVGAAGFLHALMRNGTAIPLAFQSMLIGNSWEITSIRVSKNGAFAPYMLPSGAITALYSRNHGSDLLEIKNKNVPKYVQPYTMNGINASDGVAYLDVLATRAKSKLYLHIINRKFSGYSKLKINLSELPQVYQMATMRTITEKSNMPIMSDNQSIMSESESQLSIDSRKEIEIFLAPKSVSVVEFSMK